MITEDIEQRSLDWYRQRMGYITGSRVGELMKSGRKKDDVFSQTAKAYIYQLAGERLFNKSILYSDDSYSVYLDATVATSRAMQFGIEQEPNAKRLFMKLCHPDKELIEVASCRHDTIPYFAASPDGLIRNSDGNGNMRSIEVKCPNINTYMMYRSEIHDNDSLLAVKPEYYWQMMAEMDCTGAIDGEFIAYCPWLDKPLHTVTISRDEQAIALMEQRVKMANEMIDQILQKDE